MEKGILAGWGVTLNSLLEEQRALNMCMLLAVQLQDMVTQEKLRKSLEENAAQIEQMISGNFRHHALPQ